MQFSEKQPGFKRSQIAVGRNGGGGNFDMIQGHYSDQRLVLLLTNQPDTTRLITSILESYQVVAVQTEQAAIEKAIARPPHLLLIDAAISPPSQDWWVKQVRSQTPEFISVLLLTPGADAETRANWFRNGVQDYILQPFAAEELLVRIEHQTTYQQVQQVLRRQLAPHPSDVTPLSEPSSESSQLSGWAIQKALTALQESELQFRRLADASMIGIISWDINGPILDANDMFLKMLGYTRDDLQSGRLRWTEITPPEFIPQDEIGVMELRQRGAFVPFEKEYIHKDGRRVPVVIGGAFLEGSRERGVSFVLDISDRKQAEAALKAAYDDLETRVQQRTAELSETNLRLQDEIAERLKTEVALSMNRESMRILYEVVAAPHLDFSGKVQELLALGCQRFQLDLGILGRVSDWKDASPDAGCYAIEEIHFSEQLTKTDNPLVAIAKGDVFPLSHTYCQVTLRSDEPISFEHAGHTEPWSGHPCYQDTRLEAYIAAPILVSGRVYGTISFTSPTPRPIPFTPQEKKFLQLIAQWIGSELARQQAEDALRDSEERYRLMADYSSDLISRHTPDGVYLYASPACRTVLGYEPEELIGRSIYDFFHPSDRVAFQRTQQVVTHLPDTYTLTYRARRKDGTYTWVEMTSRLVHHPESEANTQRIVISRDVNARKQAELEICTLNAELEQRVAERTAELEAAYRLKDELLRREQDARTQAEIASRMKDEFLATLSHELRTPLNSILGWSQLLRTRKFDDATTQQALETIERNARSQTQLVGDILDVSRIIRGKIRLDVGSVNLPSLVEAAIDSVKPTADAKSIHITSYHDPSFNSQADSSIGQIAGDPERLQQVMWNLLSNAIKFTPQGGQVSVHVTLRDTTLEISVQDTGEGINPEFLPYVFDRFRQADGTINRPHGGLGLGLAIVRHIVELHGGTVWASSSGIGQGATFTVSLPVREQDAPYNTGTP